MTFDQPLLSFIIIALAYN